jgi:Sec-independent protein translocase protein TatA
MEFLVVAALAFFLLGPKKMAEAGRTFGKVMKEFRAQRDELTSMIMDSADIDAKDSGRPGSRPRYTPPAPADSVAFNNKASASESSDTNTPGEDHSGGSSTDDSALPEISAPADPDRPFAPPGPAGPEARSPLSNGTDSTPNRSSQSEPGAE